MKHCASAGRAVVRRRSGGVGLAWLACLAALACPSAASAAETTGTIAGTVTSASSKSAIAGIEVCAAEYLEGIPLPGGACAKTASDGKYSITDLPVGSYTIGFFSPEDSGLNYAYQYYNDQSSSAEANPVLVEAGRTTSAINAALQDGGRISGVVTAAASQTPIADISVCASPTVDYALADGCAHTNAKGEYTISGLAAGRYKVFFSVPPDSSANYLSQYYSNTPFYSEAEEVSVAADATAAEVDASLAVGGQITGKVLDATTKVALADISVCPQIIGSNADFYASPPCVTTNAQGEYTVNDLSTGTYRVEFRANPGANYAPQYYGGVTSEIEAKQISVIAGSTTAEINASMALGGKITGKVIAASTHDALSEVSVCATAAGNYIGHCTQTNSAGEYEIEALAVGTYKVEFSAAGSYVQQYYKDGATSETAESIAVGVGTTTSKIDAELAVGGQVKGVVTSASTKAPVPGALVCASSPAALGNCTSTNAAGEYTLTGLATGEYQIDFQANGYFWQYYGGATNQSEGIAIPVTAGDTVSDIDAALTEGGHISGKVTSAATHAGLPGIDVCAYTEGEFYFGECIKTNASGAYAFNGLSPGAYTVDFESSAENYLPQYYNDKSSASEAQLVTVSYGSTASEVNAALSTGGQIDGKVTAASSKAPIAGIQVCAEPRSGELGTRCADTNAQGEYAVVGLESGTYSVSFATPSESTLNYLLQFYNDKSSYAAAETVSVTAGSPTKGVNAALASGGQISGTVTDASSKSSIASVQVCASPVTGETEERCTSTGAGGAYSISSLATGEYVVSFSTPSYGEAQYAEQYFDDKPSWAEADRVAVTAGATRTEIDAALIHKGAIAGTVTSAAGDAGIGGITVCALASPGLYTVSCATTAPNGSYELVGLNAGEYDVEFEVTSYSGLDYLTQYYNGMPSLTGATAVSVSNGATTKEIDAALHAAGEIEGEVTDASTKAGLGAVEICALPTVGGESRCTTSKAGGTYKLVGLQTGQYRVEFSAALGSNYVTQYYDAKLNWSEASTVSVTAGAATPAIDAAMVIGGTLQGTVTNASTKAQIANIEVCAQPIGSGSETRCAQTNAKGAYTIKALASGSYRVEFSAFSTSLDYVPQYYREKSLSNEATPVTITAGSTTSEIGAAMAPGGTLTGKVTNAATQSPLSDVYVCVTLAQANSSSNCVYTNAHGEYTLSSLATGEYRVEFESFSGEYSTQYYDDKGSASEATLVAVSAPATTSNIDAAMIAGGQIAGTVTSAATHLAIAGVSVCASGTSVGLPTRCATTASNGEYTISGLATGAYKVQFTPAGQNYLSQYYSGVENQSEASAVAVTYGATTPNVDAALNVGGEIAGTVTDASTKAGLSGITVCSSSGPTRQCAVSGANGEYQLLGLASGSYTVEFYPDNGANYITQYYSGKGSYSEAQAVPVTAGSTTKEINASMVPGGKITGKATNASTDAPLGGIEVCSRAPVLLFSVCQATNASGEYTIVGLPSGEYTVEFNGDGQNYLTQYYGGATVEAQAQKLSVSAGSTTPAVDAAMIVGGEIAGKVVEASTKTAIAGIEVCAASVEDAGLFFRCTTTNAEGEYTVVALSTAEYDVRFSSPSASYATQYYKLKTALAFAVPVAVTTGATVGSIDAELANLPVSIGSPSISGIAQQGHTLTEAHGTWSGAPTEYTYQWELCDSAGQECEPIAAATNQTYVPSLADAGHTLRVVESASNVAGTGAPATSAASAIVLPLPPASTSPPTISGVAQQGKELTEAHGKWENDPTEYSYKWLRCSETGTNCAAIGGATANTYTAQAADVGHTLDVQETARNAGGASEPATSAPTGVVVPPVPVNKTLPTISGIAEQGKTLTEQHGGWENAPTGYAYQWERCNASGAECHAIGGAVEETYNPATADVGHTLLVKETAKNAGGSSVPATSAVTAEVIAAVPVNISPPTISGAPQQGHTLTEEHGEWTNEPTHYTYQWSRCNAEGKACAAIAGATGVTYAPKSVDVGHTLEVSEQAGNAAGTGIAAVSSTSAVVLPAIPTNITPPAIGGTVRQGATLSEVHGTWTNAPTTYEYQWLQCSAMGTSCLPISGARESTYAPDAADVGHTLAVQEIAVNAGGASEPAQSSTSVVVLASAPVDEATPKIAGQAAPGQTLAVEHGDWTNEPTAYEDRWLRCNATGGSCQNIAGATNPSYLATAADIGHTFVVEEVAINAAGASTPASSAATSAVAVPSLQASAGESVDATVGVPIMLDASGSSPAREITGYSWSFGDGSHGSGSVIAHAYEVPGTYTATIAVHRGAESAEQHVTVTVSAAPAHGVTIKTEDSGGTPLAGIEVLYIGPSGTRIEGVSNATGVATLNGMPDGAQTLYAWAAGYRPTVGHVNVSAGGGESTVTLTAGAVATSTLSSHEMTLPEIESAGIDTSNPANRQVIEFEVRLPFVETTLEIEHCHINSEGQFVGSCGSSGEQSYCTSSACYWSGEDSAVAVPEIVEGHPLIQWLILQGKATTLKQFFAVNMVTQNLSPEPFKLTNGNAVLNLPQGLSLAPTATPQSLEQAVPDIPGLGSATTEWVIRGDETGSYYLSAAYHGTLEPFAAPVEIDASLAAPLKVWGADALGLSVKADEATPSAGVPYHVRIAVTDKAEVPLYGLKLALDETAPAHFIFQPDQSFDDEISELKPGETVLSHEYILVPATKLGTFTASLASAEVAGQQAQPDAVETVAPPPLYSVEALHDAHGEVHLHWEPVPGAEGYEVFYTPNLETPFPQQPAAVAATAGAATRVSKLPASATDAYLAGPGGWSYAVSAILAGRPTLASPAIEATPENEETTGPGYEAQPLPAAGYGYKFKNAAIGTYAQAADLMPAEILEPQQLNGLFTDLTANTVLSGDLDQAGARYEGPLLEGLWETMNGGLCYGLALSAGRFDDLSEPLYDPGRGRTEPEWQGAGNGPSASTLLPVPGGGSTGYNVQLLRLIADDYESQLSVEALESRAAQWQAYANPQHGFQAFSEQLTAAMSQGKDLYDNSGRLSTTSGTGFALVELFRPHIGHALLAYSAEHLADGTLKIDVVDSNVAASSEPQHIFVKPNGRWSYSEKTSFPQEYALGGPEEHIDIHPLYDPTGLHFYPARGAIAEVDSKATVAQPEEENGEAAPGAPIVGDGRNYDGELVRFTATQGHFELGGQSPSVSVRGPSDFLSVKGLDGSPLEVTENAARAEIRTSTDATLDVARADILAVAETADELEVGATGEITATRKTAGPISVDVTFPSAGEALKAALTATEAAPNEAIVFSPQQVAAAEAQVVQAAREGPTDHQPGTQDEGSEAHGGGGPNNVISPPTPKKEEARIGVSGVKTGAGVTVGSITVKSGAVHVTLHCRATSGACSPVAIRLTVRERLRTGRIVGVSAASSHARSTRTVVIAATTVALSAGQDKVVKISLDATGRALLAKVGKLEALLEVHSKGASLAQKRVRLQHARQASR